MAGAHSNYSHAPDCKYAALQRLIDLAQSASTFFRLDFGQSSHRVQNMSESAIIDRTLAAKYNINGPRYTSYPTALQFRAYDDKTLLSVENMQGDRDFSLYMHIPFCHSLCFYCGCNKIVTRHQDRAERYLDYLEKEIRQRCVLTAGRQVRQIHLGGGSPSFLTIAQHTRLMAMLRQYFDVAQDALISIELDPRHTDKSYLGWLMQLGYNRVSFGVQDTDHQVQHTINRVQDTGHITSLVKHAQMIGMSSVNLDLIYGLPRQNTETFAATLADVLVMAPDRISLFSYAHLPARFAAQRKIKDAWLPSAEQKLTLMELAIKTLTDAGYVMIGMDHFARPDDALCKAKESGALHRNFQGYTTHDDLDMLGLGVSAISETADVYSQNPKQLNAYYAQLDAGKPLSPVGYRLNDDDKIRRFVIQSLMCNLHLSYARVAAKFAICPTTYFADELARLAPFVEDNLVMLSDDGIRVSETARLLIRTICSTFDAYLNQPEVTHSYSRVI